MLKYKAKVERARVQSLAGNTKHDKYLGQLNEVIELEEIAHLSLEEFENMKDQVAYLKEYRSRQKSYAAYQKQLEKEMR